MFVEVLLDFLKVHFHHLPGEPEEYGGRFIQDLVPGVMTVSHNYKKDCSCMLFCVLKMSSNHYHVPSQSYPVSMQPVLSSYVYWGVGRISTNRSHNSRH